MSVPIEYRVEVFEEGDQYVGLCPELNVSSFGDSADEAEASLREAVRLFIEVCKDMGTLQEVLEESGFRHVRTPEERWVTREPVKLSTARL